MQKAGFLTMRLKYGIAEVVYNIPEKSVNEGFLGKSQLFNVNFTLEPQIAFDKESQL